MTWTSFKILACSVALLCLFCLPTNGQKPIKNYDAEWKKVETFIEKGLPKSALEEVKKIYTMAKNEKQDAQVIKAALFMTQLQSENRDNNSVLSISEIEKEINSSSEPTRSILKSLLAQQYYNYYQQHRWQMYNRTKTENFDKSDIATWDAEDFHKKIGQLYLESISEENLLQQTQLRPYDAIIEKGNVRHLRPTLYDLLVHRAINYFKNDERDIKKPAYAFEINQASAFDPAPQFVTSSFPTKDSTSLQHKALLLYQKIIAFHLRDPKPDALIDVDLQRLEFVKSKSTHPDKEELYIKALNQIANRYENLPAAAQAWYLVAQWYDQKANEYKPFGDTTHRFDRIKAKEILEKIVLQKDSSEGKYNAINLLRSINRPSFQFSVEKVNLPNLAFRSLVKYRNINLLHFRLVKVNEAMKALMETHHDEKYWPAIIAAKPERTWKQELPATNDLQQHSVEVKIDALPVGDYLLLASNTDNISSGSALLGARLFYVSAISYINNKNDFFVLDRDNGQPLNNASVEVWEQRYDYKLSKYIKEKTRQYKTDRNGYFKMEKAKKEPRDYRTNSYVLDIRHESDQLFMNDLIYDYYYYNDAGIEDPKITTSVFLFTDRSLYRPGQTVFFKGIVLSRNPADKKNEVRSGYSTAVVLRDANYKDVDTIKVSTNEFGTFNGKFQLPSAGLNGQFSLYTRDDRGYAAFQVEEYKRPKFYVEYEPVKGTYKVNENIMVTGIAKSYAGNNIDGATVKYRVVRKPRFIYPWMFWRGWWPPVEAMEIAHGEALTDKDGKFVMNFTAIPDLKLDKKLEPVFDYTVYADVTDINGETRSGEKMVSVSYKSLMMVTTVPATMSVDSFKMVYLRTQNMNGEFEPATVKMTITRLEEEKRLIRERFWERSDQFIMSKTEYIRLFPHDEYNNEKDPRSWEKGAVVSQKTDSARANGEWSVRNGKLEPGFYVIEWETKDKNGETVKDLKYIELFDEKVNKLTRPQYLWTGPGKTTVEPGESATVEIGTAANNLFVLQQVEKGTDKQDASNYSFLNLDDEKKTFEFNTTEADRGGYGVSWLFVKHNRFYHSTQTINVPWTNKDLTIEYASFRDKTLPGSGETWKLKIKGYKNDKVAAELLASMYDASLDQFYPHGWRTPYVWANWYRRSNWSGSHNFNDVQSNQRYQQEETHKYVLKQYDYLFYQDGNDFDGDGRVMRMTGAVAEKNGAPPSPESAEEDKQANGNDVILGYVTVKAEKKPEAPQGDVVIRKNFNETAFFFPDLKTDSEGNIEFSFTMPEALTRWKFMALAHTKDAAFGSSTKEIVTQKELMVQPNSPRFLREGDKIEFSTKIVNLSDKEMTGTAHLQLFDASTNEPVDGKFHSTIPNQYFTVAAGQSEAVKFPLQIPYQFNQALVWRIIAKSGNYSDGEENMLPVLTNRMLVTETMTLPVRGDVTKNFKFDKLLKTQTNPSSTLQHHALTLEYTSNPAWYAVQALPYLMEFPYECAEQMWNRYYANSLATFIANSSPKIKQVFEKWKIKDTAALMSNLQKNQELKSVLLEETPWVLQAKNEAEQKRNIALLFDMVRMSDQLDNSYNKLKQMQSPNGGFVWFPGGPDDRYITQYIVTGIGHLIQLKAVAGGQNTNLTGIISAALPYLDRKIKEDYDKLVKNKADLTKQQIGYIQVQYLYMRSFFSNVPLNSVNQKAYDFYFNQAKKFWVPQSKYMQGMIALSMHRKGDTKTATDILKSLKETAVVSEELGMYWSQTPAGKDQRRGWFWYEAPIETQALLIEAFHEVGNDMKTVDDLKTWLLKNKQTNNWNTTKATAEACYALLLQGTNWLSNEPVVEIKLGNTTVRSTDQGQEAGTGYFKTVIDGQKIQPAMGNISVTVSSPEKSPGQATGVTWGAVYWQYFEDLDKITTATTPLSHSKKLFVEKNTDRGPVITPVNDGDVLKVGDKIKVRVELRADRDFEYVHMKDMRAAGFEPVNVLSGYKYQGGLGYYESTKDASTNFFFNYLRKGTYVFEYTLFVNHTGNFSNGITSIQCMYAPEFASHSEGIRVTVE